MQVVFHCLSQQHARHRFSTVNGSREEFVLADPPDRPHTEQACGFGQQNDDAAPLAWHAGWAVELQCGDLSLA